MASAEKEMERRGLTSSVSAAASAIPLMPFIPEAQRCWDRSEDRWPVFELLAKS